MRVLFVGNSYTFYNEMPTIFQNLVEENGVEIQVDSVTKGGRQLASNFNPENEEAKLLRQYLSQNHYDVCFLQEQSVKPVLQPELFVQSVKDTFDLLRPSCSRVILYETWGRKEGSTKLEKLGMTSGDMTLHLARAYQKAADAIGSVCSRVGLAFRRVSDSHSEIELFQPDLSHPSYEGSCLAAICHYKTVFGSLPKKAGSLNLSDSVLNVFFQAAE